MINPCDVSDSSCPHSYPGRVTSNIIKDNLGFLRETCSVFPFYFDSWVRLSKEYQLDAIIDVMRKAEYFIETEESQKILDANFKQDWKNCSEILEFIRQGRLHNYLVRKTMLCRYHTSVLNVMRYGLKNMYPEIYGLFKPICCNQLGKPWSQYKPILLVNEYTVYVKPPEKPKETQSTSNSQLNQSCL